MSQEPKKMDRRNFIYAGLGAAVIIAAGAAVYLGMQGPVTTTITSTSTSVSTSTTTSTPQKTGLRVAFSPNNLGSPYWLTCQAAAVGAQEEINAHFGKEVLAMSSTEYTEDIAKQVDHIQMVIAAKYDYYVAPAITQAGSVTPLQNLHNAGIPAWLYDRDTAAEGRTYRKGVFITNNVVAGELEAKAIIAAIQAAGLPKPWKLSAIWGVLALVQ